jgi:hypothetical protein
MYVFKIYVRYFIHKKLCIHTYACFHQHKHIWAYTYCRYEPYSWWQAQGDAVKLVDGLRNSRPFPKSAYTLKPSLGVRKLCVHPAPYTPVMHMPFSRAILYEYYEMEGPKKVQTLPICDALRV